MTVALLGVGADSTNTDPTPPVYADGLFEYIPIPERDGPDGTTEDRTYGNTELRHQDLTVAEFVNKIKPRRDGPEIDGPDLKSWPFHFDPNFDALTYGESTNRGSYTKALRKLEQGDVVAFYTGLCSHESRYTDRYIIGYFTVDEIIDLQNLSYDGDTAGFSELPNEEQDRLMEEHRGNAHAKRFHTTGQIKEDDGLVIVDGTEPGGLLDKAFPISEYGGHGNHYLTDELEAQFAPESMGGSDRNAGLGGIKKAHLLNIPSGEFIDIVS